MVREITRDTVFLSMRAEPATPADLPVADDLLETLKAHKDGCVGMAANMIGVKKRIIAFDNDGKYMPMITIFKTLDIPNLNSRRQRLGQILLCSITGRSPMR